MSSPKLSLVLGSKDLVHVPLALTKYLSTLPSSTSAGLPQVEFSAEGKSSIVLTSKENSTAITGLEDVMRELVNKYAALGIAGKDSEESKQTAHYLDLAYKLPSAKFAEASKYADELDQQLSLRTYLVSAGHILTASDIAVWGAMRNSSVLLGLLKKGTHIFLARWFDHVSKLSYCAGALEELASKAKEVSTPSPLYDFGLSLCGKSKNSGPKKEAQSFNLFLGDEAKEGQVVTRFPPEPSGYLHVGHAKAAILNNYFARRYKGKLIVRFDDTNPSKENMEFESSIIEDLALMGIKPDATSHTSDYFDEIYRLAIQLIKQGDAYADDTEQELMRAQRADGVASARRDATVEENLERFAEMCRGSAEGSRWCIRAKMSVDDNNRALRDPVIYRVNVAAPHHHTGTTWKVYPTYDFACPVVDSIEGITHALRTNEYRDRNPQYAWMLEKLKLRPVNIWDFGRLNFVYTLLSKRKLQWFVDRGLVSGWSDPRFPTIRGIRRRGMSIDCIQQFILATGPSQQVLNMEWDGIWNINKRLLDPVVPRFTAIEEKDMVPCTIQGVNGVEERQLPKHKKNAEVGTKVTVFDSPIFIEQQDAKTFEDQEEITLMDWGNVYVRQKKTNAQGVVESLELEANFDGDFKKTKKKVTWLSTDAHTSRKLTPVRLFDFDYLITKMKLEEGDNFEDCLTPQTIFQTDALADFNVTELNKGDTIQFERKGYYILDDAQGDDGRRNFFHIPDGKVETSKSKAAAEGEDTVARKKKAAEEREKKRADKAQKEEEKAKKKALKAQGTTGIAAGAGVAAGAAGIFRETASAVEGASKMYKVRPVVGEVHVDPQTSSKMYSVRPII